MTLAQIDILLTARAAAAKPTRQSSRPISIAEWAAKVGADV